MIQHLHRAINRFDAAHKPFFTQCADTLFGPLAVYHGELERLKARTNQQTRMRNAKAARARENSDGLNSRSMVYAR
jgi:hypothetical protein